MYFSVGVVNKRNISLNIPELEKIITSLIKKIKYIPGGISRIIGWTKITTLAANVDKVEFYLDGIMRFTDYKPPYEWYMRAPVGIHTIETYAHDKPGNVSKALKDVFVLI